MRLTTGAFATRDRGGDKRPPLALPAGMLLRRGVGDALRTLVGEAGRGFSGEVGRNFIGECGRALGGEIGRPFTPAGEEPRCCSRLVGEGLRSRCCCGWDAGMGDGEALLLIMTVGETLRWCGGVGPARAV